MNKMLNSIKMPQIIGIFILLVTLLFISPKRTIQKILQSIWGRICMVGLVMLIAHHSMILGIVLTLILMYFIQINMNSFIIEGMTPMATENKKMESTDTSPNKMVNKLLQSAEDSEVGVDKQSIHENIQPKSSNTLPVASTASSDKVSPSSEFGSKFNTVESFV